MICNQLLPGASNAQESQHHNALMSDNDTINLVLNGEINAFEDLVRKYNQRLFRIGMSYLKDVAMAEDAMQQAYIRVYEHLARFEQRSSFATWITRIMINECLMMLRRQRNGAEHEALAAAGAGERRVQLATAESLIIEEEMRTTLEKAVLQLPEIYRTVYVMREVEHMSTDETATCLNISAENVKVRLFRAKESIRANLMKTAEGVELFGYHLGRCDVFTLRVLESIKALSKNL